MSQSCHMEKFEQYAAQGGRCWLCDEWLDMFQPSRSWGSASWEHIVPKSSGGSDDARNLVLTHHECNLARGRSLMWHMRRPVSFTQVTEMQSPDKAQKAFMRTYRRMRGIMRRMQSNSLMERST
jgi:hypothetical protein